MNYNRPVLISGIIISVLSFTSLGNADNHSQDKVFIQSAIQKMDKASNNKDANGYVVFTDPNFIGIGKSGQETTHGKEERREKLERLLASVTQITGQTTVTHFTFDKQGAVVDKSQTFSLAVTKNGQKMQMDGKGTYRDFWVKSGNIWLQQKSRTITETLTVNGHLIL